MKRNEKNIIIKDIFTEQEIKDLYSVIDNADMNDTFVQKAFCHRAYFINLPESIINKIKKVAQEHYDKELELTEVSFARYSYDMYQDGLADVTPSLYPHFDNAFHEPRFTVDFQIKSNRSWPIIVEDREYLIEDNEALTFSGTHQIHWRPHTEWKEGEFIDLIFTHFAEKDRELNSLDNDEDHKIFMKNLEDSYVEKWDEIAPPGQKATNR